MGQIEIPASERSTEGAPGGELIHSCRIGLIVMITDKEIALLDSVSDNEVYR